MDSDCSGPLLGRGRELLIDWEAPMASTFIWSFWAQGVRLGRLDQARNALKMNNHILRCRFSFNNTWEHWRQVGALDGDWEEGRLDLQAGENIVRVQTSCSSQEGWLWGVRVFTSHNRSVGWGQLREGTGRQVSNSCPDTHQV